MLENGDEITMHTAQKENRNEQTARVRFVRDHVLEEEVSCIYIVVELA